MASANSIDSQSGRNAALARRRALSAGKSALPPARERTRSGERTASLPGVPGTAQAPVPAAAARTEPAAKPGSRGDGADVARAPLAREPGSGSCREQARARRELLSRRGRGDVAPAAPSGPARRGKLPRPVQTPESPTHAGQFVTGLRIGRGSVMTGDEPGATLPISGTQYIAADAAPIRSTAPKVGLARTPAGLVVSGSQVRSNVRVTGDEAGSDARITGESDQGAHDDITPRAADDAYVTAQFNRQMDPHGHSVFGSNVGRSAAAVGSRHRVSRETALESTEGGRPITGSAVGRTGRVTGDEDGSCLHVTGDQYMSPARSQAECGGRGGGTAPGALLGRDRADPVTGGKVRIVQTFGLQPVSGTDFEYDPNVTGDARGACQVVTGTPYLGANTLHGWCEPAEVQAAGSRLRRPRGPSSNGRVPQLEGTPNGAAPAQAGGPDPAAAPARPAWLPPTPWSAPAQAPEARRGITGSFAIGHRRLTGNTEFLFKSRTPIDADARPAHTKVTGEGGNGGKISGDSWAEHKLVTGTDGIYAAGRNATERGSKAKFQTGSRAFKALAKQDESKQLVTGLLGWSGKAAAKVTLSGGSRG